MQDRRPYWSAASGQSFYTNCCYYARLFGDDRMGKVLGTHKSTQQKTYNTAEVFGILCRWFNKEPVVLDRAVYGWTGITRSLGEAFAWQKVSYDLDSALAYCDDAEFDPYKPAPYSAYDVFRILYRLKFGEWLPRHEDRQGETATFKAKDIRPKAPIIEHRGSEAGACRDGVEPGSVPPKPKDGAALFAAIGKMDRPDYEHPEMQENRGRK